MKQPLPAHNNFFSLLIFSSRWLQAPLYFGLIIAQAVYVYQFVIELIHLISNVNALNETLVMLTVLGLIDVVMISNLLIMVIIGGYETFVSRLGVDNHPDAPEWLSHINANTMKIKLALALIGISSIHLLKSFINLDAANSTDILVEEKKVMWQVIIHVSFLFSAFFMAYTSKVAHIITHGSEGQGAAKHD